MTGIRGGIDLGNTVMTAEPLAFPFLLFGVVIAVVVAVVIIGAIQAKRRREAFAALARELGLGYTARDNTIASTYSFLDKLRQGSNRYAYNVIEGEYKGHFVRVFDFHFETHSTDSKGRKQTHHHNFSFFMLYQERPWPELRIYPENILSRFGQMLGFDDIDLKASSSRRRLRCGRRTSASPMTSATRK